MSVKLIYGVETLSTCLNAERLGGFCYSRLNPTGRAYGDKVRTESTKILIDLAKYSSSDLSKENPIDICLDYGMVPVESKNVRDITIHNSKDPKAPISQEFTMEPREETMQQYDNVFHILLLERLDYLPVIQAQTQSKSNSPDTHFKFRVVFKPKLASIAYTSTLLVWVGSIPLRLKCHGFSEGPYVSFSQNVLNFGGQYYGSESRIRINMMNHSICEAQFQFDTDNFRSPFKFCPCVGIIPPKTNVKLEVVFRPHKPQTYYKRVYCLLHQQNPQYLDLIGVCVPRPFFMDSPIDFCVSSAETRFLPLPSPTFEEYFQHDTWGIKLSNDNLSFGGVDLKSKDDLQTSKSFMLTSTLPYDVLIEWAPDPTQIFHVTPPSAFLNSRQQLEFNVHFSPQLPDAFFSGQLECYIYPTTLVWPPREGPPWVHARRLQKLERQRTFLSGNTVRSVSVEATEDDIEGILSLPKTSTGMESVRTTATDQLSRHLHDGFEAASNLIDEFEGEGRHRASSKHGDEESDLHDIYQDAHHTRRHMHFKKSRAENKRRSRLSEEKSKPETSPEVNTRTFEEEYGEAYEEEPYEYVPSIMQDTSPVETHQFGKIPFMLTIENGANVVTHAVPALKHGKPEPLDPEPDELLEELCTPPAKPRSPTRLDAVTEPEEEEHGEVEDVEFDEMTQPSPDLEDIKDNQKRKGKSEMGTGEGDIPEIDSGHDSSTKKPRDGMAIVKGKRSDTSTKSDETRKSRASDKTKAHHKEKRKHSKKKSNDGGESDGQIGNVEHQIETEEVANVELDEDIWEEKFFKEAPDAFEGAEGSETEQHWGCGDGVSLQNRTESFNILKGSVESDGGGPSELALPLCLTIRVAGHTYQPSSQPPIPQVQFPSKVTMNPALPQYREFRTIVMKNISDLPVLYEIKDIGTTKVFDVKPVFGVIPGGGRQTVMISMNTSSPETAAYGENCIVNLNVIDDNQLSIFGYAEVPTLFLSILNDASGNVIGISCPTTVPGYSTETKISMRNPSRFHYRFTIEFADENEQLRPVFTPYPWNGIIAPYDTVHITWKFIPHEFANYVVPWRFRFEVMGAKSEENIWNAVYEITTQLMGLGSECHLSVEPEVLNFDLVQIFNTASGYFTVSNLGKSLVTANLVVKHEQWLQWYNQGQVILTPALITLNGGEKIDVHITVRPERPVMYKFYVEYELDRDERIYDGGYTLPASKRNILLWIYFMGSHSMAKVTGVQQLSSHPCWDSYQCWEMFSVDELNKLMQPLKNAAREGTLPQVPSVSFRFPSAPVGTAPALFAVNLFNMGGLDQHWVIYTQPPKNSKLYQLQQMNQREKFSAYTVDELDDPSFLTALWTEKYRELSIMRKQKLLDSSLTMAALKNSENFKIVPTEGINRSYQIINFKFSYDVEGIFVMPALLRVYPAIFVWIDLHGICLHHTQPSLQLMHSKLMEFHPIGLNDLDPPIQMLWAYNGGVVSGTFQVFLEPFRKMKRRNFGHACIECLTPEGVALPKTWTAIKLRFAPIEYHPYELHLRISFNEEVQQLTLRGYPTLAEDVFLRPQAFPYQAEVTDPFVPVTLTPSVVTFPHFIPTGDRATSIIFITNQSSKHSMSFSWPEVTYINSTSISFLPDVGILAPMENCACQVIVTAGGVNQILRSTVRCLVEDITAINQYITKEKLWKGELVEYKEVTVVTKKGPQKKKMAANHTEPAKPPSCSCLLSISCYIGSSFGTLDNIWTKEQSKMPFSDPLGVQPLPENSSMRQFALSPINNHLAQDVLRQVLWDIVMLSPNWPSYVRQITKRESVYYDDYKASEHSRELLDEMKPIFRLPRKTKEEIMEFLLFTMLQEMGDHYANGEKDWAALRPGALV